MSRKKIGASSELRIRCDEELHRQLAEAARRSLRSMTREVIFRLRASLGEQLPPIKGRGPNS
jgi:predicted HicB family RNase H-like nuclease